MPYDEDDDGDEDDAEEDIYTHTHDHDHTDDEKIDSYARDDKMNEHTILSKPLKTLRSGHSIYGDDDGDDVSVSNGYINDVIPIGDNEDIIILSLPRKVRMVKGDAPMTWKCIRKSCGWMVIITFSRDVLITTIITSTFVDGYQSSPAGDIDIFGNDLVDMCR